MQSDEDAERDTSAELSEWAGGSGARSVEYKDLTVSLDALGGTHRILQEHERKTKTWRTRMQMQVYRLDTRGVPRVKIAKTIGVSAAWISKLLAEVIPEMALRSSPAGIALGIPAEYLISRAKAALEVGAGSIEVEGVEIGIEREATGGANNFFFRLPPRVKKKPNA